MAAMKAVKAPRVIGSDCEAIAVAEEFARAIAPGASARDVARKPPFAEADELSASGLMGITVPRGFGGADVSCETIARIFQVISAADPAIGQLPQNHFLFADAIRQDGTPDQKRFFFGELLAGARLGNAQAEKGSSSTVDLGTRLSSNGEGRYRLDGTKVYCTGARLADWMPVAAFDESEHLVLALVPRGAEGVSVFDDWNGMGQRVTYSGTVVFENVAVPEFHVVQHWRLFERVSLFHAFGALLHAAIDVGIAQNALDDALAFVRGRKRPRLGASAVSAVEDPLLLMRFGQLGTKFHAAESLLVDAARTLDNVVPATNAVNAARASVAVSEAKAFAEDVVIEITNELFALAGSSATDDGLNLHRHWRNARTHTVHDTNQWRYHNVGNYLLNNVAPDKPIRRLVDAKSLKAHAEPRSCEALSAIMRRAN
jgi:SfnB family sulfur acquisition oxidoreductase